MKPVKIFAVLIGLVWVCVVGTVITNMFVFAYSKVSPFFLFSAAIQVVLTAIAIIVYLYQLITIYRVDITEPVIKTQKTLVRLKTTSLWVTKILFLQLPVWTTFYLSQSMFVKENTFFLVVQGIVTVIFSWLAVWLFVNIKYENRYRKWFRLIFNGQEWTPLLKSMDLLDQINDYTFSDSNTTARSGKS